MSYFQEVYSRILMATNARTQVELANVLEIRQSSISDAKRRDSVPADWYMKLFEKFGLNPDWLKKGSGPMYLRVDQNYAPVEAPGAMVAESPAAFGDPLSKNTITTVYDMFCTYVAGEGRPDLQSAGKIAMPQAFVAPETTVLRVDSEAFAPMVRKGAYIGIDTTLNHPVSGELFAVFMPHEGLSLKRIFLDSTRNCFVLRTDTPGHPESTLDAETCQERLFGRVSWVLQQL